MATRTGTAVAALAALLVTFGVPMGDACPIAGAADHRCCAGSVAEHSSSIEACCGEAESGEDPGRSADAGEDAGGCDCLHAPAKPAAVAAATQADPGDTEGSPLSDSATATVKPGSTSFDGRSHHVPRTPLPPIFLLGCAFLI